MNISNSNPEEEALLRCQKALSVWENEDVANLNETQSEFPEMTNAELVHLRIRVIAMENLIISLLAEGSDRQLEVSRQMAAYISPRAGFTQHPLTIKASDQMSDMVSRAEHFRTVNST